MGSESEGRGEGIGERRERGSEGSEGASGEPGGGGERGTFRSGLLSSSETVKSFKQKSGP